MIAASAEMLEPLAAPGARVGPLTRVRPQMSHQLHANYMQGLQPKKVLWIWIRICLSRLDPDPGSRGSKNYPQK
jgi:hypothetical protein